MVRLPRLRNRSDSFDIKQRACRFRQALFSFLVSAISSLNIAIIACIEDGAVYLAERNTLSSVKISIINKKTGEEIGSCPVMIETDATDDEVYEKLRDNDFYLTFLGIPIADSIEKLNAMEWRQDFYDYLQNDPSSFLSDLSNEDFDVDGLTVDDLSFTVK